MEIISENVNQVFEHVVKLLLIAIYKWKCWYPPKLLFYFLSISLIAIGYMIKNQTINLKFILLLLLSIYPNNSRDVYLYIYSVSAYMG